MPDSDYTRVTVRNNWGANEYSLRGVRIDPRKVRSCTVRWPDGSIDMGAPIRVVSNPVSVGDHGHTYSTTSHDLFLVTSVHGVETLVPLKDVDVAQVHP